jgi:hypothetical protein
MRRTLFRTLVTMPNPDEEKQIADAIRADLRAEDRTDLLDWLERNEDHFYKMISHEYAEALASELKEHSYPRALYGHTSPETAYFTPDYPGGFRKRLERRDWVEFKPSKGYRWVYQTRDKGSSRWNNPKPSTYSDWAAGLYLDEKGHIQWLSLGTFSDAPAFMRFIEMFPKMDKEQQLNLMGVTFAMVSRRRANVLMLKQGRTGWTINNVPVPVKPGDIERAEEELAGWEKVLTKLNNLKG